MLKIRVMNISKKDLGKTLKRYKGTAWDQSPLFKKVYEEEYGQFGGEPFGCLVGDYHFDHSPPDVELLGEMAKIAAAAHAPFIAGAVADADADGVVAGAGQPARPDQDLPDRRNTPPGARCANRRTRATSAWPCRASWRACPTAPRPTRSRSSTSRKTPRAPTTASTPGPTPPTRWRSTSTARSSCTAGARASAASSRAARSKACRATRSRPLTWLGWSAPVDPEIAGLDAVQRRERSAEDVVEATVLVRPLEREDVDGLLDDADHRPVAARVGANAAERLLGQVAALAARTDSRLDLRDRRADGVRLVGGRREDVEREPLRRARADPGKAGELRDEVVDRGAQHGSSVPSLPARGPIRKPRRVCSGCGSLDRATPSIARTRGMCRLAQKRLESTSFHAPATDVGLGRPGPRSLRKYPKEGYEDPSGTSEGRHMPSRRFSPSLWMVLLLVAAILVPTTLAASRGDKTFSTRNAYNDRRAPKPVELPQRRASRQRQRDARLVPHLGQRRRRGLRRVPRRRSQVPDGVHGLHVQ